jgi:glycosyltransferase involved in cell wall biosynthesis
VPTAIAYLVNQYPKMSHTFIRREILALEALGRRIERFSIRRVGEDLADAADREEAKKTRVVLDVGVIGLLSALMRTLLFRPGSFLSALRSAIRMGYRSERGLILHFAYLAEACVLVPWLERAGVEHVHAHFGTNSTTVAMLASQIGGVPFSFTVHGPEEFDKPDLIGLSEKIRRARFVVGVSSFGRSQLYRRCHAVDWPKIHVVRCGVDQSFLDEQRVTPSTAPRLVCVGRLCEQKGQILLVRAAARLKEIGAHFELVLVGGGELQSLIESMISEHGLADQVRITGWASGETVRREILAARALVLPSFAEGLPVAIMEALALGRPVITTYVAGIPELVENGQCGWLVPAGSVEDLVTAMQACLTASAEDLLRMGMEGRKRVIERHDVRACARALNELFPHEEVRETEQAHPEPRPTLPSAASSAEVEGLSRRTEA